MGFRVRRSIQIVPGVRMNVSGKGVGYSVGGKGYRVTKHVNGRVSRTVSLPGTGISHSQTISRPRQATRSGSSRSSSSARITLPTAPAPPKAVKPGLLSPNWEKDLYAAWHQDNLTGFAAVARDHGRSQPAVRVLAAALDGLWHFSQPGADGDFRARELLSWVVAQQTNLATHPFVTRYLQDQKWPVEIADGVTAELRLSNDVVLLAAAELHQAAGDLDTAIWTVEQAEPTAIAALSLTELYSDAGRHADVIDVTTGITNADDATAFLLALRGRAFAQQGYFDAARESLKEALRIRTRSPDVRHRALLDRAGVNLAQNRKSAARKDVETVLAEDPHYPGLQELLANLPSR